MSDKVCIYENTCIQRLSVSKIKDDRDYLIFSVDYDNGNNPKLTREEAIQLRNEIIELLKKEGILQREEVFNYSDNLFYNFVNVIERYLEDDESDVETFVKKYLKEG